jgi:hypothetical protein
MNGIRNMADFQVLLKDNTLNIVKSVFELDAAAAVKTNPGRFSRVAWAIGAQVAGQHATVQGGPGQWTLARCPGGDRGLPRARSVGWVRFAEPPAYQLLRAPEAAESTPSA